MKAADATTASGGFEPPTLRVRKPLKLCPLSYGGRGGRYQATGLRQAFRNRAGGRYAENNLSTTGHSRVRGVASRAIRQSPAGVIGKGFLMGETQTRRLWVAYGPAGAVGTIEKSEESEYTVKMAGAGCALGRYPSMDVARMRCSRS